MTISFEAESTDGLLTVTTSGQDDNPEEVIAYGSAVIDLAIRNHASRILCDERNLEYRLGTVDTFRAAEAIAARAPKVARVAIVCKPSDFEDGKFWETVAVNRGLEARFFTDIDKARIWVLKDVD